MRESEKLQARFDEQLEFERRESERKLKEESRIWNEIDEQCDENATFLTITNEALEKTIE